MDPFARSMRNDMGQLLIADMSPPLSRRFKRLVARGLQDAGIAFSIITCSESMSLMSEHRSGSCVQSRAPLYSYECAALLVSPHQNAISRPLSGMLYCQGAFFNVASYGDGAWQVTKQWIPVLHLGPPGQRIHFLGV